MERVIYHQIRTSSILDQYVGYIIVWVITFVFLTSHGWVIDRIILLVVLHWEGLNYQMIKYTLDNKIFWLMIVEK